MTRPDDPRKGVRRGHGITVPLPGVALSEHGEWFRRLEDLGYTDLWSLETDAYDGFTPLALAAACTERVRLGTAVVPVYTRGPATLAMSAAAMANAAPGRFALGIGASSPAIVERWNAAAFDRPRARVRDTVRFLRSALRGDKVTQDYETFSVDGFRLSAKVAQPPPLLVAALRPRMLEVAATEADGAVLTFCSARDVRTVAAHLGPTSELVARIYVVPSTDRAHVRSVVGRPLAAYLTVPTYAEFHRWLGHGDVLAPVWEAWAAGDRARAVELIPDSVIDDLVLHGTWEEIRAHVARYVEHGVTTPVLALWGAGRDLAQTVRELAPR